MADKRRKSTSPGSEPPTPDAIELAERWSVQRKTGAGAPCPAVARHSEARAQTAADRASRRPGSLWMRRV